MPISLHNVTFAYAGAQPLLEDTSIAIEPGSYLLIRGPSGAGKSTLLRLLCRLEEPQSGAVRFHGTDIRDIPPAELRRQVAYVQQTPSLIDGSVRENLMLAFSFKANAGLEQPSNGSLRERLEAFGLDSVPLEQNARTLSVGEAQRLCLIRTLLLQPEVLLMDEPTSALDAASASVVLEAAHRLNQDGKTLLMISHADASPDGATGTLRLEEGRVHVE